MVFSDVDFVGAKIVSAGYMYGELVELTLEQPDGKKERISFGVRAVKFDELKNGWKD